MNNILQMSNRLEQKDRGPGGGPRNIHANELVKIEHIDLLIRQLKSALEWWDKEDLLPGAIIDVEYRTVVPKSNRIQALFSGNGKKANDSVVGARFTEGGEKHVITHYLDKLSVVEKTIEKLENAKLILDADDRFDGQITYDQIDKLDDSIIYDDYGLSKSSFLNIIVDSYHIENFRIPQRTVDTSQNSIVTIYDTGLDIFELMQKLEIEILPGNLVHTSTLLLSKNEIEILNEKAPFLIAMSADEETSLDVDISTDDEVTENIITIEPPGDEPVIGVIDKAFSDKVYFKDWVEYHDMLDENLPRASDDAVHGTAVTSIIVDGPSFNRHLEDGCGKFRVRHFGVATGKNFSSFTVMKLIRDIVRKHRDIKVWNLSLGSDKEINRNSISPEAAMLDELQYEFNDIIFVVAGTNKGVLDGDSEKIIGAPADSINSVVVNSVTSSGTSASYSRKGIVLSFFNKPDICAQGGEGRDSITVCTPDNWAGSKAGTSFAAPWVTRKLAYLIHILGLPREVAKALIIDSAAKWDTNTIDHAMAPYIGHGIVPTHINDIVKSSDDEIRFIISGTSKKWDTYNYNLPVPVENGHHPFVARATLCYFPKCSINQGVDYTNTELDLYFGRIAEGKLSKYVKSINGNVQQVLSGERFTVNEKDARVLYRKWDNTKRVQDKYTSRTRSKVALEKGLWGLSVKTNDRLNNGDGKDIKFGVVATLKEINGKNRIDSFVQQCQLRGWLVEPLNVETQVDIYAAAQAPIEFD
jgi:hypothetical protein